MQIKNETTFQLHGDRLLNEQFLAALKYAGFCVDVFADREYSTKRGRRGHNLYFKVKLGARQLAAVVTQQLALNEHLPD